MKTKTKIIKALIERKDAMTIKDISRKIAADYRITHTAAQMLIGEDIINIKKVGNNLLCSINDKYHGREIYLAEEERKEDILKDKNLKQLYKDILAGIGTYFFILLLVERSNYEIRFLFISNEPNFKKKVQDVISLIPLNTSAEVITEKEFKRMKDSKEDNIAAKAMQHSIILHGLESFYLLKNS